MEHMLSNVVHQICKIEIVCYYLKAFDIIDIQSPRQIAGIIPPYSRCQEIVKALNHALEILLEMYASASQERWGTK